MRVRHFGFLANRSKKQALAQCRKLLDTRSGVAKISHSISAKDLLLKFTGLDLSRCPCCHEGTMIVVGDLPPSFELASLGFFMNNTQSHLISCASRSAQLGAGAWLALAKTHAKAASTVSAITEKPPRTSSIIVH